MNPLLQLQQPQSSDAAAESSGAAMAALSKQLETAQEEKKTVFKELEQFFIAHSCHPHVPKRSSLSLVSSGPAGNYTISSPSSSSPVSPRPGSGLSYSSSAITTSASSSSSPVSILENFKKLLYQYEEKVCQVDRLSQTLNGALTSSTGSAPSTTPVVVVVSSPPPPPSSSSSQLQPPPPPPPLPPSLNNNNNNATKANARESGGKTSSLRSSLLRSKSGQ